MKNGRKEYFTSRGRTRTTCGARFLFCDQEHDKRRAILLSPICCPPLPFHGSPDERGSTNRISTSNHTLFDHVVVITGLEDQGILLGAACKNSDKSFKVFPLTRLSLYPSSLGDGVRTVTNEVEIHSYFGTFYRQLQTLGSCTLFAARNVGELFSIRLTEVSPARSWGTL